MTVQEIETSIDQADISKWINSKLRLLSDSRLNIPNSEAGILGELLTAILQDDLKNAKSLFLGLALSIILGPIFSSITGNRTEETFLPECPQPTKATAAIEKLRMSFIDKFRVRDEELTLVTKIIEGIPLKQFEDEIGISSSNANKKIRRLWQRLGLENRMQLVFIAGWFHLISIDLECLKSGGLLE